jgi:hypothetical protein
MLGFAPLASAPLGDDGDPSGKARVTLSGFPLSVTLNEPIVTAIASIVVSGYSLTLNLRFLSSVKGSAEVNPIGYPLSVSLGQISKVTINRIVLDGVSASFTLGDAVVQAGTGATEVLPSLPIQINLGTVKPNIDIFVSGYPLVVTLNNDVFVTGGGTATPTGFNLSFTLNAVTSSGVIFNYASFADNYSPVRTILLPKRDTRSDRIALTEERY